MFRFGFDYLLKNVNLKKSIWSKRFNIKRNQTLKAKLLFNHYIPVRIINFNSE